MGIRQAIARMQTFFSKINRRLENLAARFGKKSSTYQNAAAEIDASIPDNHKRFKDGVLQVHHPASYVKEGGDPTDQPLPPTYQSIKDEYQNSYDNYVQDQIFEQQPASFSEFIDTMNNIKNNLPILYDNNNDDAKTALAIMRKRGERKSYSELAHVSNVIEDLL